MVSELRVNVASAVRGLEASRKLLAEGRVISRYRRVFKGSGLEFEDFREYTSKDDASKIDWRASKRSNKLVIRQYREEREMNVYFMVDVSSSMLFGSTEKLKYESVAELVAALSHFIIQTGDMVGLVLFSDKVVKYVSPGKGSNHFYLLLKSLLTPELYGGGFNMTSALEFLKNTARERSLLFLVSDFIGLERNWETAIKEVAGKFDGVAVMVKDPRDRRLPKGVGQVVISDPYSDREMLIDCSDEKAPEYARYVQREEERINDAMRAAHWDVLPITTEESFVMPVIKFLKRREEVSK